MKKWKICDHIPPWADAHNQRCLYWSLIVTAIVCSAALYFPLLRMTHNDLSYSDQTMVYFSDIVGSQGDLGGWYSQAVLSPFLLLIPGAVVLAVYNYTKLWQGAKNASISWAACRPVGAPPPVLDPAVGVAPVRRPAAGFDAAGLLWHLLSHYAGGLPRPGQRPNCSKISPTCSTPSSRTPVCLDLDWRLP